ncbi:MAG TPA: serine/threonine-protein kinase, partial [Ktedonobacteraceae bacterium]|nr:serine/threonine-protein kinase [Ktedonobacteraceae bacterium]
MANREGQQIGHYRLSRLLGKGGFAEVYVGEHIHLKTRAAVKMLETQLAKNEAEKFRLEAQTLAHLVNPHIVRVLEFGFDNDSPYLIMDFAPNGTLRQLHPKGSTVPLPTIISYVKQIAAALFYAHSNGIIHRDVKPENMLLGRQMELLLSDFGIAIVAQSSRLSNSQLIAGTAPYMAPEQINGKPCSASDQYALGVVVYEWLVGVTPFQGSLAEISTQHLLTSPPSLRGRVATVPFQVEQVVLTALEKDPDRRFRSVQSFANALEQASFSAQPPANPAVPVRKAGSLPGTPASTSQKADPSQDTGKEVFSTTLPALPKANFSNFWWPTFFVPLAERRAICSGIVPQEQLGVTGDVIPSTSPLLPLPVSISESQPLTGSLLNIPDRPRPAPSQPADQLVNMQPKAETKNQGSIVRSTRTSPPKQPAAPAGQTGAAPQATRSAA